MEPNKKFYWKLGAVIFGSLAAAISFFFNIRISRDKRFLISYYVRTSAGISRSGAGVCVVSDCKISGTAI